MTRIFIIVFPVMLIVFGFVACKNGANSQDQSLIIAKDGLSDYSIVLSEDASEVEIFAAAELKNYINKISGCDLPISFSAVKGIFVGGSFVRNVATELSRDVDHFVIESVGESVYIGGSNDRSVLYGVYDLLEEWGCRWYAPDFSYYGESGREIIPLRTTLVIAPISISEKASFKYRRKNIGEGWSHNEQNLIQMIDWMAKNKMNLLSSQAVYIRPRPDEDKLDTIEWDNWRTVLIPELKKRGMMIAVGGHGYQNYLRQIDYFDEHPEWFGMTKGKRSSKPNIVFCTSNDEALAEFIRGIIAYLRAHPEIDIFQLWPPDSETWCQCDLCSTIDGPNNRHAFLINRVTETINKELPEVMVECIAYRHYLAPPKGVPLTENIIVDFCPYARTYQTPINDDNNQINRFYRELIEQWIDDECFHGDIGIFSYYRKYIWRSLPVVIPNTIAADLNYYNSIGVNGLSSYSEPADWLTYEVNHYVIAQALWQAELDINWLMDDYSQHSFPGADREIREYFELIERAVPNANRIYQSKLYAITNTQEKVKYKYDFDVRTSISNGLKPYTKFLQRCDELLDASVRKTQSRRQRLMIEKLKLSLEYAKMDAETKQLCLQLSEMGDANKLDKVVEQTAAMRKFLQDHRNEGVFLLNSYVRF